MLRQEAWFRMAATEAGMQCENAVINHRKGTILYEGKPRQLIFPKKYFRCAESLDHRKKYKYSFAGKWAPHRHWLLEYCGQGSYILFNDNGRHEPADVFDTRYYSIMAQSEYVLCPAGCDARDGYEWTYRFFEAVLCRAVPVLKPTEYKNGLPAVYSGYTCVFGDNSVPDFEKATEDNFSLLLERGSLCRL